MRRGRLVGPDGDDPAEFKGINVHVLPPPALQSAFDPLAQPIVIRADARGRYYLNSKQVSLADLANSLESAFRTRPNWTVYVIGDPEADYGDVVEVMDAVRTAHGTVILLTGNELRPGQGI